jgi:hypothetical protein
LLLYFIFRKIQDQIATKKHKIYSQTYPHTIRQDRRSDKLELRSFNKKLVISCLIKQNHVVHLFLLLPFAPFLHIAKKTINNLRDYTEIYTKLNIESVTDENNPKSQSGTPIVTIPITQKKPNNPKSK